MPRVSTFADRLTRLRTVAQLSARGLAQLAEIAPSHVSLIEKTEGESRVAIRTVEKLARVLGTTLDWLYSGRGVAPTDDDVVAAVSKAGRAAKRTGTDG